MIYLVWNKNTLIERITFSDKKQCAQWCPHTFGKLLLLLERVLFVWPHTKVDQINLFCWPLFILSFKKTIKTTEHKKKKQKWLWDQGEFSGHNFPPPDPRTTINIIEVICLDIYPRKNIHAFQKWVAFPFNSTSYFIQKICHITHRNHNSLFS